MDTKGVKESIDKALIEYKGAQEKLNGLLDKLKGPIGEKLRKDANSMDEIIKGYNFDQNGSTNTSD